MSYSQQAVMQALAHVFDRHGRSLFVVGGCVRDELLGIAGHDLDYTTNAEPEEIKAFLRETNPEGLYAMGERFGTIGAVYGDYRVEITTYRSETYTPGSR